MLLIGTLIFNIGLQTDAADTYLNPVIDSNHTDPGVLKLFDNSGFVAKSVENSRGNAGRISSTVFH
jgi:hypothetical protein